MAGKGGYSLLLLGEEESLLWQSLLLLLLRLEEDSRLYCLLRRIVACKRVLPYTRHPWHANRLNRLVRHRGLRPHRALTSSYSHMQP